MRTYDVRKEEGEIASKMISRARRDEGRNRQGETTYDEVVRENDGEALPSLGLETSKD
jgi:hypothetical protein